MAFVHSLQVSNTYTAGGASNLTTETVSATGSAEANLSQSFTTDASASDTALEFEGFSYETASEALGCYFLLSSDGTIPSGKLTDDNDTLIAELVKGVSYVWMTGNYPAGRTNPLTDAITSLKFVPYDTAATSTAGTLDVKILFNADTA